MTELSTRLESLNQMEGTLVEMSASIHADMVELSARVKRLGKQLDVLPTPRLEPGDLFPELTLESADGAVEVRERWRDGPLAVAFMRHFGCSFCREHLARLDQARGEFQAAGGDVVAVFQNRGRQVRDFCHHRGVGLECVGDPRREGYDAVGLKKGSWTEYLGPQLAKRYVRAARSGYLPGMPKGDVAQRPGTFVVGTDGRIAFAHYNRDSSDNPTTDAVVAAVREAARASAAGAPRNS
jgi:peroxiredoxin